MAYTLHSYADLISASRATSRTLLGEPTRVLLGLCKGAGGETHPHVSRTQFVAVG
jgi:hypothetical protein